LAGLSVTISGKTLRKERGTKLLTQKALAEAADVSIPAIERIERDREGKGVRVRPGSLFALAGALDVDPRDLLVEGRSVPLGEIGSPLDQAKFQAMRLERREAEAEGRGDKFWSRQWGIAERCVEDTVKLLRRVEGDPVQRREALDLLERFIALERRAEERYFALYGWKLPRDVASQEPLEAEDRESIEANA
jgi:transcriptional regulator with XRE-family HTH domain